MEFCVLLKCKVFLEIAEEASSCVYRMMNWSWPSSLYHAHVIKTDPYDSSRNDKISLCFTPYTINAPQLPWVSLPRRHLKRDKSWALVELGVVLLYERGCCRQHRGEVSPCGSLQTCIHVLTYICLIRTILPLTQRSGFSYVLCPCMVCS